MGYPRRTLTTSSRPCLCSVVEKFKVDQKVIKIYSLSMFVVKSSFLVFDPIARSVEHPRVVFSRTSAASYILFQNRQNHILFITRVFKFSLFLILPKVREMWHFTSFWRQIILSCRVCELSILSEIHVKRYTSTQRYSLNRLFSISHAID